MARPARKAVEPVAAHAPRLFIYGRFSSQKQADGDSYNRQMTYAHEWAIKNGFEVDDSLTMFDHGLSAYKGDHVKKGALGAFLKAIQKEMVRPGDVLLVESLDRLSRAEELDALGQFATIVQAGITIISMQDGIYNQERIRETQGGILHAALAVMTRAHNESERKSYLVTKTAHAICRAWDAGQGKTRIPVGKDPSWVEWDKADKRFELRPDQVASLEAMIGFFRAGYSATRLFAQMEASGIPLPEGIGNVARVNRVVKNRALVGEKIIQVGETTYTIPNYYPAILTEDEFTSLQHVRKQRGRRVGKGEVISFVTGMRLTFCAACGHAMANQNIMNRSRRADGLPQDGHRRLQCSGEQKSVNRCRAGSCSIVPVERAVMEFCSDQMNLASLFVDGNEKTKTLSAALTHARQEVEQAQAALDTFIEVGALDSKGAGAKVIRERIAKLSTDVDERTAQVSHLEYELASLHRHSTPAVAEVWAALRKSVTQLDNEARIKARQLVADTFARIEIGLAHVDLIELRLVSKRDVVRTLQIDRKTGERRDENVVEDPQHEALKPRRRAKDRVTA
ncbi:recombinase family protein [Caballeronia cordobensis]|uniref:recombinase family protein n=1 Tax=Caballeronia cordobensis TaxID=1353886 RepID=UPI00045EE155|nr:Gp53 phage protein [Burkholderia sp. RPE67]